MLQKQSSMITRESRIPADPSRKSKSWGTTVLFSDSHPLLHSSVWPSSTFVFSKNGEWAITPVLRDATAVAGCGIGGVVSAVHGFNTGIPYVQKHVKGPKWLPFLIGIPPFLIYSAASAAFGGYTVPRFAQVTVSSYYVASSVSHYGISLLTTNIEHHHHQEDKD